MGIIPFYTSCNLTLTDCIVNSFWELHLSRLYELDFTYFLTGYNFPHSHSSMLHIWVYDRQRLWRIKLFFIWETRLRKTRDLIISCQNGMCVTQRYCTHLRTIEANMPNGSQIHTYRRTAPLRRRTMRIWLTFKLRLPCQLHRSAHLGQMWWEQAPKKEMMNNTGPKPPSDCSLKGCEPDASGQVEGGRTRWFIRSWKQQGADGFHATFSRSEGLRADLHGISSGQRPADTRFGFQMT